jgi:putative hemolysin
MIAELLIVLALLVANGVFAGAEIAVVSQRRTKLIELVEGGQHGAKALLALREDPERFLATVQIGITVVGASAAAFSGASISARLEPAIARIPGLADYADEIAFAIVVAILSYLSIVIGELVPKSLALRAGERYALLVARPLQVVAWLARPFVRLLTASSNLLLRPFGDSTTFTEARHSSAEVMQIVEEAVQAGTVHKTAGEIATRALELPDLTAADVMIAREQVVMIPRTADAARVREILAEHRYSRLPVYGDDPDDIVGYLSIKDILGLMLTDAEISIAAVMRPPMFVPQTQRAVDLLREMRTRRVPFGVVVDERGTMAGIVTLEDVLEELVGDIYSEHAGVEQEATQREGPGVTLVSGSVAVREINRDLGLELPEDGEWTTIAGLCTALAGRIPSAGDALQLAEGVSLEIVDASPRRVRTVRIRAPIRARVEHETNAPKHG